MAKCLTQDEFITKARKFQGNNIDLSEAIYLNNRTKIKVGCRACGFKWDISPKPLLIREIKCPKCSGRDRINSNFSDMSMTLYFIKIRTEIESEPEFVYKVGITKYNVINRFSSEDMRKIEILKEIRFTNGEEAYNYEQAIHEGMDKYSYNGKFRLASNGNTELLTIDPLKWLESRL